LERWRAYVESLPGGLGAFPTVECKAAVIRSFFRSYGQPKLPDDLPRELGLLATAPPPVSVFVPAVHARAFFLAMGDAQGWSDEELVRRTRVANDDLFGGVLYRAVFMFISPRRMLEHAPSRWALFHRMSTATMESIAETSCVMVVREPALLMSELLGRMHGTAVASALTAVGAKNVEVSSRVRPDVRYEARWTT
jgi:hypothetical protein